MKANKPRAIVLFAALLGALAVTSVMQSQGAYALSIVRYENVSTSLNSSIYLSKGVALVVRNSKLKINGSITGGGSNNITIINSSINASTIQVSGPGYATISNSSIVGLAKPVVLAGYSASIDTLSLQGGSADTDLLTLRGINNTVVRGISYSFTHSYRYTSSISIRIEGCNNLILDGINGTGIYSVNTPHFHIVTTGPGNKLQSSNIVVQNSYFYGGGNGVSTGAVSWVNDTFEKVVDGTEWWWKGNTSVINSTFKGCKDTEINLQNSYTISQGSTQLFFTNCIFDQGKINMDNGYAKLVNCTFKNGFTIKDTGDNSGGNKYNGTMSFSNVSCGKLCAGKMHFTSATFKWNKSTSPPSVIIAGYVP